MEVPTFDPTVTYEIHAHNKKYTGDSNGLRFNNGLGVLNALPKTAPAEEKERRVAQLMWFHNSPNAVKVITTEEGEIVRKQFPGYVITAQRKEAVPA